MLIDRLTEGLEDTPRFIPLGMSEEEAAGQLALPIMSRRHTKRPLYRANEAMRLVQRRILLMLRVSSYAITPRFIGSNINARGLGYNHRARFLYVVDLASAFGSVNLDTLTTVLTHDPSYYGTTWLGEASPHEVREMLRLFCASPQGGLIQGGAASPYLYHLYAHELLDVPLRRSFQHDWNTGRHINPNWTATQDLYYTRYVDDLVFSSDKIPIGKRKQAHIKAVIREAGFTVSPHKTRLYDLDRGPVVINGIGVRRTRHTIRTFMPRPQLARLEGMLHLANTGREVNVSELFGLMGLFRLATQGNHLNATEKAVAEAYKKFMNTRPPQKTHHSPYMSWPDAMAKVCNGWLPGPYLQYLVEGSYF